MSSSDDRTPAADPRHTAPELPKETVVSGLAVAELADEDAAGERVENPTNVRPAEGVGEHPEPSEHAGPTDGRDGGGESA